MKKVIKILFILVLFSCSSRTEKMINDIEPNIKENFPSATFEIITENNLQKLIILDNGNSITEENLDFIMTSTLGSFYKSFYISSSTAPTNSKLVILYESETLKWESKTYDLFQLGEMFNLVRE
jgi:hypothetical protein